MQGLHETAKPHLYQKSPIDVSILIYQKFKLKTVELLWKKRRNKKYVFLKGSVIKINRQAIKVVCVNLTSERDEVSSRD